MALLDATIGLLVGSRQLDSTKIIQRCRTDTHYATEAMRQHQERCVDKMYPGLEQKQKEVKFVTSEGCVPLPSENK